MVVEVRNFLDLASIMACHVHGCLPPKMMEACHTRWPSSCAHCCHVPLLESGHMVQRNVVLMASLKPWGWPSGSCSFQPSIRAVWYWNKKRSPRGLSTLFTPFFTALRSRTLLSSNCRIRRLWVCDACTSVSESSITRWHSVTAEECSCGIGILQTFYLVFYFELQCIMQTWLEAMGTQEKIYRMEIVAAVQALGRKVCSQLNVS